MSYYGVVTAIREAIARTGRSDVPTLVAVSKGQSPAQVMAVYELGHRDFGENRAQEMAEKAAVLPADIRWHFVGSLQANKARLVRPITTLLHSLDRPSLAAAWVKGPGLPPPVLVQVDLAGEEQKSGVPPEAAAATVEMALELGLTVRGLMAIPPAPDDPESSRHYFAELRDLRDRIVGDHPAVTELSMGMTDDYVVAIEEGSTIVRVGRAIFGSRQ
jgi:pyridoxal phosphate enzyme (YggS family)